MPGGKLAEDQVAPKSTEVYTVPSAPASNLEAAAEEAADSQSGAEGGVVQVAPEFVEVETVEPTKSIQ
jgi:hypothetical protein